MVHLFFAVEDDEMKKKQAAVMERLRSKRSSQHRSWTDSLMKSIRTTVVVSVLFVH